MVCGWVGGSDGVWVGRGLMVCGWVGGLMVCG